MSMESDLVALLQAICPQVYPDVAPGGVVAPYIVWQAIGGEALRFGDGTAPEKRHTMLQVAVWSTTRAEALTLIHQAEDAICAASWQATPQGEAASTYEPDTGLRGSLQRFNVWATR
jgi:hypothetical protein